MKLKSQGALPVASISSESGVGPALELRSKEGNALEITRGEGAGVAFAISSDGHITSADIVSPETFGAVADGVTNAAPAINAAIAALGPSGGDIRLGEGVYAVASTISLADKRNVTLVGVGGNLPIYSASPTTAGTVLKWTGAAGGTVVKIGASAAAAEGNRGGGIRNLSIDGDNIADKGLEIRSHWWGDFRGLHIRHCDVVQLDLNTHTDIVDDLEDSQGNLFSSITIRATESAIGMRLGGGAAAAEGNASLNTFTNLLVYHDDGVGVQLGDCDTNTFVHLVINRAAGGTGIGLELQGNAAGGGVGHARHNVFVNFQAVGGVTSRNATTPASDNLILGYNMGNSTPTPVIEAGSSLYVLSDRFAVPNDVPIKGRNAAGSADVAIAKINTLNEVAFDTASRFSNHLTIGGGINLVFSTSTGTKIGTSTTQLIGFWNKAPVAQPAANANTSGATLAALETEVNELKQLLRDVGFMAP